MFSRPFVLFQEEVRKPFLSGILLIAVVGCLSAAEQDIGDASAAAKNVAISDGSFADPEAKRSLHYSFGLGKKSGDEEVQLPEEQMLLEELDQVEPDLKRSGLSQKDPSRFAFGLGKRGGDERNRFGFGLGKRPDERNRFGFGLGKRPDERNRFGFGLGKRPDERNRFGFGLGKRPDDYNRFGFGLGKRPDERNRFGFGLGKRPDERNRFGFGLGKRGEERNRFGFGLGKRGDEYNRFAFGLGKRGEEDGIYDYMYDLDFPDQEVDKRRMHGLRGQPEDFTKRRYNFGLGKRSIPEESVRHEEKPTQ